MLLHSTMMLLLETGHQRLSLAIGPKNGLPKLLCKRQRQRLVVVIRFECIDALKANVSSARLVYIDNEVRPIDPNSSRRQHRPHQRLPCQKAATPQAMAQRRCSVWEAAVCARL